MDIKKLIKEEAPKAYVGDLHDAAYANALKLAYDIYKDADLSQLKVW